MELNQATTEDVSSPVRKREPLEKSLALLSRISAIDDRDREPRNVPPTQRPANEYGGVADVMPSLGGLAPTPRSWQSYATSVAVHGGALALLLAITFPAVQQLRPPVDRFVLLEPRIQPYRPKLIHPVHPKITVPLIKTIAIPQPVIKPREIKPNIPPAPVIKQMEPVPLPRVPEPKIEALAPAPKPAVRTGVFTNQELAKGPSAPKQVTIGGFGDPKGVPPNVQNSQSLTMAKLGGFDLPNGEAKGGAGGRAVVGQTSFGNLGDPNGAPTGVARGGAVRSSGFGDGPGGTGTGGQGGQPGAVRSGGFQDAAVRQAGNSQAAAPSQPASTPAEILFKPKPVYTQEARDLKLEGQVSLEVIFQASGVVRVIRVLHGLGHGLDEAAEQAAQQIRFRPATRAGVPVDTAATLYITFQVT
jgi:TonB family protein